MHTVLYYAHMKQREIKDGTLLESLFIIAPFLSVISIPFLFCFFPPQHDLNVLLARYICQRRSNSTEKSIKPEEGSSFLLPFFCSSPRPGTFALSIPIPTMPQKIKAEAQFRYSGHIFGLHFVRVQYRTVLFV